MSETDNKKSIIDNITLKELIEKYGLPIDVKKSWWFGDYYFRAEKIQHTGVVAGTIFKDGKIYESKSFSQGDIMQLLTPLSIEESKSVKKKSYIFLPNPNKLDTDITHYIKGETKLFVKSGNSIKVAIFDHFREKNDQLLIYVIPEGAINVRFYPFPQSEFVFPNKDDARSKIDKESRRFEISHSHNIVSAFKKKPKSRKPSENTSDEYEYERGYHQKVDSKLEDDLRIPEENKRVAQYDLAYADEELREEIVSARENKYIVDDHTIISHKIRKETADSRILSAQDEILRIRGIRSKPYFARIDCGESMRDLHTVYLGNDDIDGYVVSWKNAEYGNAYYQSSVLQGREDIVLALKRIVDITYGDFKGYEDEISLYADGDIFEKTENEIVEGKTDELLNRLLLESRADKQVHDIIKTIQGEQYDIITSDFRKNVIVNGCAGSGKTMIMYHRLSYMAYNYRLYLGKTFDTNLVYIISPSPFFDSSNDELLTKLSIGTVYQAPFSNFVDKLLDLYCSKKSIIPFYGLTSYLDALGESPSEFFNTNEFNSFTDVIEAVDENALLYKEWALSLINQFLTSQNFKKIDFEVIAKYANEASTFFSSSDYYYNECFANKNNGETKYYSKQAIVGISMENVIAALNTKHGKSSAIYKQRLKKITKYLSILRCCLSLKTKKTLGSEISTDISDFWDLLDNTKVFEKMLSIILAERLFECISTYVNVERGYMLKCLYAFQNTYSKNESEVVKLYFLHSLSKKYGAIVSEDALVFVDEFQNYSAFELQCVKEAYEHPVFNLFGDYDQRIEEKGANLKAQLKSILVEPNIYNINVNYRNAKQITEYINRCVHKNMQSIGVDGSVIEVALEDCDFKLSDRTAIICKDIKMALPFIKRYIDAKLINNSTSTKELAMDKYTLITVDDSKGLEFDTVYVLDYGMSDNEKYVAYTRALDTLIVISDDLEAIKKSEEEAEKKRREQERLTLETRKKEENFQKHIVEENAEYEFEEEKLKIREEAERKLRMEIERQVREEIEHEIREEIEHQLREEADVAEKRKKEYNRMCNVCQYCGGRFKGLLVKRCSACGKRKDY